jgi:hypothetical protein
MAALHAQSAQNAPRYIVFTAAAMNAAIIGIILKIDCTAARTGTKLMVTIPEFTPHSMEIIPGRTVVIPVVVVPIGYLTQYSATVVLVLNERLE